MADEDILRQYAAPRGRDPDGPQAVSVDPFAGESQAPKPTGKLRARMRELVASGMPRSVAIMTAADEKLIAPKAAEGMLRVLSQAEAATGPGEAPVPPGYWNDSEVPGATPEQAAQVKEQVLQEQLAADPEMSQAPAPARSFPPSGPASAGGPPMPRSFPPSGPAPGGRRPIDPALIALIQRQKGR